MTAGHADHFLSRLDRLDRAQTELALSLYRDHELVRGVLARVRVPEGLERVAIALEPGDKAPHVLVTREGRFVTCLGQGMTVSHCHVLPRAHLDALAERIAALRARDRHDGRHGAGARGLLEKLYHAGPHLSREDFLAIAALQPLMYRDLWDILNEYMTLLSRLAPAALKMHGRTAPERDVLEALWKASHGVSHLSVLCTLDDGAKVFGELPPAALRRFTPALLGVTAGELGLSLRGFWAVANVGEPMIAPFREHLGTAADYAMFQHSGLGLIAIALRSPHLGARVREVLASVESYGAGLGGVPAGELRDVMCKTFDLLQTHSEAVVRARFDAPTRASIEAVLVDLGVSEEDRAALEYPVGDLRAFALNIIPYTPSGQPNATRRLRYALPWAARAKPEEFYLPQDSARRFYAPWHVEDSRMLFGPVREAVERLRPPRSWRDRRRGSAATTRVTAARARSTSAAAARRRPAETLQERRHQPRGGLPEPPRERRRVELREAKLARALLVFQERGRE